MGHPRKKGIAHFQPMLDGQEHSTERGRDGVPNSGVGGHNSSHMHEDEYENKIYPRQGARKRGRRRRASGNEEVFGRE
eukprot:12015284-Karenia_brevis.AAC.1